MRARTVHSREMDNVDLERQLAELTARVRALEVAMSDRTTPPPPVPSDVARPVAPPPPGWATSPLGTAAAPTSNRRAFEWGIESVLRWAGVGLVTLAGIFLVSTAVSRGWIGPELQLLAAALGGVGLHMAAVRLAASRRSWPLALSSGGTIVLGACAIATHEWLELVGAEAAVGFLAGTTVAAAAIALHLPRPGVAMVAGLVALIAPLDTLAGLGDEVLLSWVVACILASTAFGLVVTWTLPRLVTGWVGATILAVYALVETVTGQLRTLGLIGSGLVAVVLWIGPVLAARSSASPGGPVVARSRWSPPGPGSSSDGRSASVSAGLGALDIRLLATVPAWTWVAFSGVIDPESSQGVSHVALITALCFLVLSVAAWRHLPRNAALSTLLGSIVLLAVGFVVRLSGPALMVVLAGQAAVSYYLGRRLVDRPLTYSGYVFAAISSLLAAGEIAAAIDRDGFHSVGAGVATLVIAACWAALAVLSFHGLHGTARAFRPAFLVAWVGFLAWTAAACLAMPQGLMAISVVWAAMGAAALVIGLRERVEFMRDVAMATLGVTLLKLVGVDMAEVDVFWRVGLFAVVGTGLIVLGLRIPSLVPTDRKADGGGDGSGLPLDPSNGHPVTS